MVYFVEGSAMRRLAFVGLTVMGIAALGPVAIADDKPPLAPDTVAPFTTGSRISAAIEFGLPALASTLNAIFRNGWLRSMSG